jgi:hypothetical protein
MVVSGAQLEMRARDYHREPAKWHAHQQRPALTKQERHHESDQDFPMAGGCADLSSRVGGVCNLRHAPTMESGQTVRS